LLYSGLWGDTFSNTHAAFLQIHSTITLTSAEKTLWCVCGQGYISFDEKTKP
jgi:hypothetical protein